MQGNNEFICLYFVLFHVKLFSSVKKTYFKIHFPI